MANVMIEIDTEESTLKVSVDGKNIPDVRNIHVYKYMEIEMDEEEVEETVRVEIISGTEDEETGINRTLITTCAGDKIEEKDEITHSLAQVLFRDKF